MATSADWYADAYFNRGNAWNGKDDQDRAIKDFGSAVRFKRACWAY